MRQDWYDRNGTEYSRLNTSSKLETDWLTTGFKYMRLVRDPTHDRVEGSDLSEETNTFNLIKHRLS